MKNIFKNPYSFYRRKNCLYDKENIFLITYIQKKNYKLKKKL